GGPRLPLGHGRGPRGRAPGAGGPRPARRRPPPPPLRRRTAPSRDRRGPRPAARPARARRADRGPGRPAAPRGAGAAARGDGPRHGGARREPRRAPRRRGRRAPRPARPGAGRGPHPLAPTVLLAPLAVRSLRGAALRLLPIVLSAAGLAWTTALLGEAPALSGEAWLVGLKEAARITAFVAPGVLALASVRPTPLGDALAQRLHLPARPVAAAVLALVRVGHLGRQWSTILETRVRRGLGTPR